MLQLILRVLGVAHAMGENMSIWNMFKMNILLPPMNPHSLSPALPRNHFYILLALSRGSLHGYDIKAVAYNDSLGGLSLSYGRCYLTLKAMVKLGLVEEMGLAEVGKHNKPRMIYGISPEGKIRLKDDLRRAKHAYAAGER